VCPDDRTCSIGGVFLLWCSRIFCRGLMLFCCLLRLPVGSGVYRVFACPSLLMLTVFGRCRISCRLGRRLWFRCGLLGCFCGELLSRILLSCRRRFRRGMCCWRGRLGKQDDVSSRRPVLRSIFSLFQKWLLGRFGWLV